MADDNVFSGSGGSGGPDYQVGPPPEILATMQNFIAKLGNQTVTHIDVPPIFPPSASTDNAAALTKMITDLTSTPKKLAAFTDLVAFISKFMAA